MTTIRTTTTVQTTGGPTDSNLDALLEDLQTSVHRNPGSTVNGTHSGKTKVYREVTRTVKHDTKPGYQVEYLAPANTTTVVDERAPSPNIDLITQAASNSGVTAYKTMSYEYNTTKKSSRVLPSDSSYEYSNNQKLASIPPETTYEYSTSKKSASLMPETTMLKSRPIEDAGLRKNLTELDSLLVDLHHAQKAGFGSDHGSRGRSRSREAVPLTRGGVDLGLLEPLDSSTPAPPSRGQQHVSRSTVQERTYHTYNTGSSRESSSPQRYQTEPSPRVQPKRSSSVNRELIYESNGSTPIEHISHHRSNRTPSPHRRDHGSPQVPRRNNNNNNNKQVIYEKTTTTTTGSSRQPRSTSSPQHNERYRDRSPSNQRLHREVYNYEKNVDSRNNSVPASPRQDRYQEMSPPSQRRNHSPSPVRSTVRSYNYSTTSNTNNTTTSPRPYRSPSPISRSPVEKCPVVELPRRSPSPSLVYQNNQPPTKVTTTVRTYTYELPPSQSPFPPGNSYTVQEPQDYTLTNTYKEPEQPPTVITYKYSSSHSSHNSNTKYPQNDPLDNHPRPFPTPSPQPGPNGEPPKKLEELMASFGDTEITQQRSNNPPGYFTSERQTTVSRSQAPPQEPNGVAVVAPINAKPPPPAPDSVRNRGNQKNVAGPPVYYPPGVELFAHKDQEAKMMSSKASGEYEMSRESQSKGSSGGGGVVPVCLPVCCAMPCTIM